MKTVPLSEAKAKLSKLIDDVADRDERVMVTRHGRPAAVILSPDELESWLATLDILTDPVAMAQIEASEKARKRGRLKSYTLEELFGD